MLIRREQWASAVVERCLPAIGGLLAGALMAGCHPRAERAEAADTATAGFTPIAAASASAPRRSSQGRYSLGIVGYNYTEVGITDYLANGTGAFNLGVSREDSGGGSTICCFSWTPAAKLPLSVQIDGPATERPGVARP